MQLELLIAGDNIRAARTFVTNTFDGTWSDPESLSIWEHFVVHGPSPEIPEPPDGARRPAEAHADVGDAGCDDAWHAGRVDAGDSTLARRHPLRVTDASRATVDGRALTAAERNALTQASGGISVGYRLVGLRATPSSRGILVTGRAVRADGAPAPGVVLLSYRLQGTITDASGNPVRGATVVTRTTDRDFWTFSEPSNANGHYVSYFSASDESGSDPVALSVQVAAGTISYASGTRNVSFSRLHSATMDVRLPPSGTTLALPVSTPEIGAFYRGLLVGASGPGGVIKPLAARWPAKDGRFSLLLPGSVRGKTLRFWESDFAPFSRSPARPGGAIDLRTWPTKLSPRVARDVAFLAVGR